jgi:hypothetical protein
MDATSSNKINGEGGTQNSKMLKAQWKLIPTYNLFRRGSNSHSCKGT